MWRNGSLRKGAALGILAAWLAGVPPVGWAGEEIPADRAPEPARPASGAAERAQLFVALLRRRAERILESRRAPPPPLFGVSAGVSHGYESNVNLDGFRKGDVFVEETAGLAFQPAFTRWLRGEFAYDFLGTEFYEFTDSSLGSHTFKGVFQFQPRRQIQLDLGYEYGILNFPLDTDNSFSDHRFKATVSYAQLPWITHKAGWAYQQREYDTRLARDSSQNKLLGLNREDERHGGVYELRLRWRRAFGRLGVEGYRNLSNDQYLEFYDWDDLRFRGSLTWLFGPKWTGTLAAGHERKNYGSRSVPAIAVAQRDNLATLAGSLIWQPHPHANLSISTTYRHQDSNDPRLDFTDWIHQAGVTFSF